MTFPTPCRECGGFGHQHKFWCKTPLQPAPDHKVEAANRVEEIKLRSHEYQHWGKLVQKANEARRTEEVKLWKGVLGPSAPIRAEKIVVGKGDPWEIATSETEHMAFGKKIHQELEDHLKVYKTTDAIKKLREIISPHLAENENIFAGLKRIIGEWKAFKQVEKSSVSQISIDDDRKWSEIQKQLGIMGCPSDQQLEILTKRLKEISYVPPDVKLLKYVITNKPTLIAYEILAFNGNKMPVQLNVYMNNLRAHAYE